jgi:23S rRNA (uracil1939-C5)-methyltransferase
MKIGEEYTLTPRTMAQGGDAVGRISGWPCFVSGALPGETVNVKITHVTNTYARATVVNVLTPAPERVIPRVGRCPHMEWQYIASDAQLEFKRQILRKTMTYLGKLSDLPEITAVAGSNPWHYRNSARLHGYGTHLWLSGRKKRPCDCSSR